MTAAPTPAVPSEPPLTGDAALSDAELAEIARLIEAADIQDPLNLTKQLDYSGDFVAILDDGTGVEARIYVEETADLIVAAVNALPRLVASLRSAREEIADLRSSETAAGTALDDLRAERDQAQARLETMTAVAKSNKRHVQAYAEEVERLSAALAGAEQATTDARRQVAAVRQLHQQYRDVYATAESGDSCSECNTHAEFRVPWPCPTIQALAADVPAAADDHYLSTACYHGHHGVCGKAQHANGDPSEPHCKFCETRCSCPKHTDPLAPCAGGARKRRHHPTCARPDDDSHIGWCGPNAVPAAGEAEVPGA